MGVGFDIPYVCPSAHEPNGNSSINQVKISPSERGGCTVASLSTTDVLRLRERSQGGDPQDLQSISRQI